MTIEEVMGAIAAYEPFCFEPREVQRAAVLVPLRRRAGEDGLELILTRRAEELEDHSGQVSFPGGRFADVDASATDAALREAHEELGIPPQQVEIVGRLDDMITVTGFHVVPMVGLVAPEVELVPDAREVARVFAVPMRELLRAERWEQRLHEWKGSQLRVWHFPYDGEDVWGATGRTVRCLVELLWKVGAPAA